MTMVTLLSGLDEDIFVVPFRLVTLQNKPCCDPDGLRHLASADNLVAGISMSCGKLAIHEFGVFFFFFVVRKS